MFENILLYITSLFSVVDSSSIDTNVNKQSNVVYIDKMGCVNSENTFLNKGVNGSINYLNSDKTVAYIDVRNNSPHGLAIFKDSDKSIIDEYDSREGVLSSSVIDFKNSSLVNQFLYDDEYQIFIESFASGKIKSIEVLDSEGALSFGLYYKVSGEHVSMVKNGSGVKSIFDNKGNIIGFSNVVDGIVLKEAKTLENGNIEYFQDGGSKGLKHGVRVIYSPDHKILSAENS